MFMLDNIPSFGFGFIVGFGSGFVSREIVSTGQTIMRPMIKLVVKSGYLAMEKGRESMARFAESFEDLVAEAKTEAEQERVTVSHEGGNVRSVASTHGETAHGHKVIHRKTKARRRSAT